MVQNRLRRSKISEIFSWLALISGVLLMVAVSFELLEGVDAFSPQFLSVQLFVCVVFMTDFFLRWHASYFSRRFFFCNLFYLLLSIPYLNIVKWLNLTPASQWGLLIGLVPLLRVFMALYLVVMWMARGRVKQIFVTYLLAVTLFTYVSALGFYYYESPVNESLGGFGDALWWAGASLATVGSNIYPVTAVGKILAVVLPLLGMMLLPVFTVYFVSSLSFSEPREDDNQDEN